jgi:hypothetical protein
VSLRACARTTPTLRFALKCAHTHLNANLHRYMCAHFSARSFLSFLALSAALDPIHLGGRQGRGFGSILVLRVLSILLINNSLIENRKTLISKIHI